MILHFRSFGPFDRGILVLGIWLALTSPARAGQWTQRPLVGSSASDVSSALFSPDGSILASIHAVSSTVKFWDVATGKCLGTATGVRGHPRFSKDGKELFVFRIEVDPHGKRVSDQLFLYDVPSGKLLKQSSRTGSLQVLAICSDGVHAALGTIGKVKRTKEARARHLDESAQTDGPGMDVELVSLATPWDLNSGKSIRVIQTPLVAGFSFSPDGSILAMQTDEQASALWNVTSGKQIPLLDKDQRPDKLGSSSASMFFSPDSKFFTNAGDIWETAGGKWMSDDALGLFTSGKDITFSRNGETIAITSHVGDEPRRVEFRDLPSGKNRGFIKLKIGFYHMSQIGRAHV